MTLIMLDLQIDSGDQYAMEDYHVLSMEDFSSPCVDHGEGTSFKRYTMGKKTTMGTRCCLQK